MRVLLADDHRIVRQGLRALLEDEGCSVVAEAGDGQEAVDLARRFRPDVAVLDLSMPGLNGIEAGRVIVRSHEATKVVLLTVHREDHYVAAALRAGITGYVLKTQAATDLIDAMTRVASGSVYVSPGVSREAVEDAAREEGCGPLTPRERQVLQLVAEGRTTKEVASTLGISVKTADTHRTRIMEKLDIHEVAGLVRYAIRRGVIQP
jgi:DNA-binding NarL/FixJ family response regulator